MPEFWIGIGANIGNPIEAFDDTWSTLNEIPHVNCQKRSGVYLTRPVGEVAGGAFTNAVFSLKTSLPPLQVLDLLQEIENGLGRTRGIRWGPRPIDLDLLFADQIVLNDPRLTLPHPGAWYRRFVIDPLAEVAPNLKHPLLNETVHQLRHRLLRRPLSIGILAPSNPQDSINLSEVGERFPEIQILNSGNRVGTVDVIVRLRANEPYGPVWENIPVADVTASPGTCQQRLVDFCTAVLDQPVRFADW